MIQFNQKKFIKCLLGPAANTGDNNGEQVNMCLLFHPAIPLWKFTLNTHLHSDKTTLIQGYLL